MAAICRQSDKEGWPAARFLATIAGHEIAERGRRRVERHLVEARLPAGKTFDNFDFEAVPMIRSYLTSHLGTWRYGREDPVVN